MDTQSLLAEAKAKFAHNSAKHYLQEKYSSKLLVAEQGGLWKADKETITFLSNIQSVQEEVVLLDTYNNPVKVNSLELYTKLIEVYNKIMNQWYEEWKDLESKR